MSLRTSSATTSPRELRRLYDEAVESGALDAYRKRRWGQAEEFVPWLAVDSLPSLGNDQAMRLYRASGGRDAVAFATNPIEEVRDSLDFLLYDTIKLEGRFDECVQDGAAYRLPGAGKEFVSWLLCLRNPSLFGVWNNNAERLLRRSGAYPESMKRGPMGIRYLDLLEGLNWLRAQTGLSSLIEVDMMSHLFARPAMKSDKTAGTGAK